MTEPSPRPRSPEAIVFDLDGTLIDTYRLYIESYRRAIVAFTGSIPDEPLFERQLPSSERRFLAEFVGPDAVGECHAEMCRIYEALHPHLFDGVYDGVREMLNGLRAAGIPIAIVTGKSRPVWELTSRMVDLGPFASVVTDDDVSRAKPDPEGILRAAAELRSEPDRLVYVGDSLGDLVAGRAAGAMIGAALWPKTAPGEAEQFVLEAEAYRPDWVFETPGTVTRTFAAWC